MLADGIPIGESLHRFSVSATTPLTSAVYQGQEQHYSGGPDPYDREAVWLSSYSTTAPLYKLTQSLNAIRSMALAKSSDYLTWHTQTVYSDDHNVAFRKGDASYMTLMVLSNLGQNALNYSVQMDNVGFPAGLTVVELLSCTTVVTDSNGGLDVPYVAGLPMVRFNVSLPLRHVKLADLDVRSSIHNFYFRVLDGAAIDMLRIRIPMYHRIR